MKKSFKLFIDSLDVLDELTDEQAGQLFKAIRAYELNQEEILTGLMKAIFTPFKNNIDRAKAEYEAVCERNKANGLKGGRPNPNKPSGLKSNPNNPDKDKDKDKDKIRKDIVVGFTKPTLEDLQNHISKMNYQVDAIKFLAYYESNGWKVGRNKMKCWKSTLTTWQSNNNTKQQPKSFKQQENDAIDQSVENYYRMKEQGFDLQEELIKQAQREKQQGGYNELN